MILSRDNVAVRQSNIQILVETDELRFPKVSWFTNLLIRKEVKSEWGNIAQKKILASYLINNVENFYKDFAAYLSDKFGVVLLDGVVPNRNFTVHLNISLEGEGQGYVARYVSEKSSQTDCWINISLANNVLRDVFCLDASDFTETLHHEFLHYLDDKYIQKSEAVSKRLLSKPLFFGFSADDLERINKELEKKPKKTAFWRRIYFIVAKGLIKYSEKEYNLSHYPPNLQAIYRFFTDARTEGLAVCYHKIKSHKFIEFDPKFLIQTEYTLRKMSEVSKSQLRNLQSVLKSIRATKNFKALSYTAGAMIAALIIMHRLFLTGFRFSVWIEGSFGKENNAGIIDKYYGFQKFELYFSLLEKGVKNEVHKAFEEIFNMKHLQFFQAYEEACRYFRIKKRFFDSHSYHYYASLAIYNYKKATLGVDDRKLREQIERFKLKE